MFMMTKKINFGIIGFGNIAKKFLQTVPYTTGKVVAIASKSLQEDDQLVKNQNIKIYRDYDLLLNDPNIDAVYIALPHNLHKEWIIKAANKHKAILCEKPAVLTTSEFDEIKDVLKKNDCYFLEAFKTIFNDGFKALKKDLELISPIISIEDNFCSEAYYHVNRNSYLLDKQQGGALNDIGSYVIGFILALNDSDVIEIRSKFECENEIDLNFHTKLVFKDGMIGYMHGSINEQREREAIIKGIKGTIKIPMYNRITDYTITLENEIIERSFPITGNDMVQEIQALIDDVQNNKTQNDDFGLEESKRLLDIMEKIRNQK